SVGIRYHCAARNIILFPLLTGKIEKTNSQRLQNAAKLQKTNGRSRATAPTEWGEYGKIAIYRRDCKMQPSCKNRAGGAEPPPLRSEARGTIRQCRAAALQQIAPRQM
ncbi:MAG: hypothetical protein RSF00_05415, partial [Oscillospiraceae bacterium]